LSPLEACFVDLSGRKVVEIDVSPVAVDFVDVARSGRLEIDETHRTLPLNARR
jgi:hypothetical protein